MQHAHESPESMTTFTLFQGVWLPVLMAIFDTRQLPSLEELSEKELRDASLESTALCLGEAFKVMLLTLVLARAPLQPCLCPATHLTDMATAHGLNFLASPQALFHHYGLAR